MDILYKDENETTYRFQCDCSQPGHVLDVRMLREWQSPLFLTLYCSNLASWTYRLKAIWQLLRRHEIDLEEIILCRDDRHALINILQQGQRCKL